MQDKILCNPILIRYKASSEKIWGYLTILNQPAAQPKQYRDIRDLSDPTDTLDPSSENMRYPDQKPTNLTRKPIY